MKTRKLPNPIGRYEVLYDLCELVLNEFESNGGKFSVTKYTPVKRSTGVIYFIKLTFRDGNILYKLGYTSRTVYHRIETLGIPLGTKIRVLASLPFTSVQTAFNVEQLLHEKFQNYKYKGKNVLSNGNSELYYNDILSIWKSEKLKV